jgi:hypothetical protein
MIDDILKERNARYGDFHTEARIAQELKDVLSGHPATLSWAQRQAIDMICVKLARIVNGDPDYADNWADIIGYCTLVLRHIEEREK